MIVMMMMMMVMMMMTEIIVIVIAVTIMMAMLESLIVVLSWFSYPTTMMIDELNIAYFFKQRLKGNMKYMYLQNIVGVLKRNKIIVT